MRTAIVAILSALVTLTLGWTATANTSEAKPVADIIEYTCWFEPKEDGTFEGYCGPSDDRPANAYDDMRLELPEGFDPATVQRWRALGAYDSPEDECECLYVPVAPGFAAG